MTAEQCHSGFKIWNGNVSMNTSVQAAQSFNSWQLCSPMCESSATASHTYCTLVVSHLKVLQVDRPEVCLRQLGQGR